MALLTRSAYLRFCASQVGEREQPDGSNRTKYGRAFGWNGVAWCQIADWWTRWACHMAHFRTASTMAAVAKARGDGTWHDGLKGVQPGDSVYFHWSNSSRPKNQPDHVETVKYRISGGVRTYGGNVGNAYREQNRRANILGYIRHEFAPEPKPVPKKLVTRNFGVRKHSYQVLTPFGIVGKLKKGDRVAVIETKLGVRRIKVGRIDGWVPAYILK